MIKRSAKLNIILLILAVSISGLLSSCVDKVVQVPETYYETEYRTETSTETYTETENVVVHSDKGWDILRPVVQWAGFHIYILPEINSIRYYGYHISMVPHSSSKVTVTLSPGAIDDKGVINIYDLTGLGQIPVIPTETEHYYASWSPKQIAWFQGMDFILKQARLLATVNTGNNVSASRNITFDAQGVIDFAVLANTYYYESVDRVRIDWQDNVIQPQQITKERQVSYQVPIQVEKQRTADKIVQVPFWELFTK